MPSRSIASAAGPPNTPQVLPDPVGAWTSPDRPAR
jgi:hypothetical protein